MQLLSVAIHALRPASFLIYREEQGYDEAKSPINIKFAWEQEKNYPEKIFLTGGLRFIINLNPLNFHTILCFLFSFPKADTSFLDLCAFIVRIRTLFCFKCHDATA